MTTTLDQETVELLADEPELLALADAVAAARIDRSPRRRLSRRVLLVPAAAAALVALALVSPWDRGGTTLVERARAAIGDAPVLHAVTREVLDSGETLVDLKTGERTAVRYVQEQEIWFDGEAKLAHTITRTNGSVTDDVLETKDGGVTMDGPVITCAWIARHPEEATKQRVSCRFDGDNSKMTVLEFPQRPPAVDPALGGFLTQYRAALVAGRAKKVGEGRVVGHRVHWLSIPITVPVDPTAPPAPIVDQHELVALDRETYRPVLVRTVINGSTVRAYRVVDIGTVSRTEADFSTPKRRRSHEPTIGETAGKTVVDRAAAARVLGRPPLWLGNEFAGFKLVAIERQEVRTAYAPSTGVAPRFDGALLFTYAGEGGARLRLEESNQPLFAFGWVHGPLQAAVDPPAGQVLLGGFGGFLIKDGVYVAIQTFGNTDLVVTAAQALRPM